MKTRIINMKSNIKRTFITLSLILSVLTLFSCGIKNNKIDSSTNNKKNEYTGINKDYNVIEIMIETGASWLVNETLTPNTYKLMNEGIKFNNNYTKNKTNVSEYIGITGFGGDVNNLSSYAPYSLAHMLKNNGYKNRYYHVNNGSFYSRSSLLPKLGFDETYFFRDILTEEERPEFTTSGSWNGNYPLDTEFIEDCLEETNFISKDEKFYTYWTTISTHGPYNYGKDNIKIYKEMGLYDKIDYAIENNLYELPINKYYDAETGELSGVFTSYSPEFIEVTNQIYCIQSEMMVFDLALGMILDKLEEDNLIDNTLIIMYGDHDAYYQTNRSRADLQLGYYVHGTSDIDDVSIYDTIMCMYNPTLNNKYKELNNKMDYDYFTSTNIIVPTALDILGIDYNINNYVGRSIFSNIDKYDNIFYSHQLKTYFTNEFILNKDNELINLSDSNDSELFMNKVEELKKRMEYIEKIIG